MTVKKYLRFSLIKIWLLLSIVLSCLIAPISSVSLNIASLPTNLQSGVLKYNALPFNTGALRVNFEFNLPNTDKYQLSTSIAYPEIYEMQINQLRINTLFSSNPIIINLKQKTQLIEILKLDTNLAMPVSVSLISAQTPLKDAENQPLLVGLKILLIFILIGVVLLTLAVLRKAYVKCINLNPRLLDSKQSDVIVFFFLLLLSGLYSLFRGQDFNWDLQNYHFYNPYAFLNNRLLFDIEPVGVHSYFSPMLDIFNYLVIRNLTPMLSAFVLGAASGLFAFAVYKIIRLIYAQDTKLALIRSANPSLYMASILLSLVLAITGFANLTQIGTTMNENFIAIPVTWSYYYLLKYQNEHKNSWLFFSGLLIGVALGLKLTAIVFVLALVISFIALNYRQLFSLSSIGFGVAIIVGFLLINGIWMFKMYQVFGNPFFPSLGAWFNPDSAVTFGRDTTFSPKDLWHGIFLPIYLLFPNHLTSEQTVLEPRYALFFGLFICAIFKAKDFFSNNLLKLLIVNLVVGYVLWEIVFSIQRYTVSLEALCGILSIVLLNYLFHTKTQAHKAMLMISILVLLISKAGNFNHIGYAHKFTELGIPADKLPQNALVIYGNYPMAYLSEPLGASNVYMNRPGDKGSQFNERRRSATVIKFRDSKRDIFLIDKNPEEMRKDNAEWLTKYALAIGTCLTFNNTPRQIMCRLIKSEAANAK